jgi:hypothetical protein
VIFYLKMKRKVRVRILVSSRKNWKKKKKTRRYINWPQAKMHAFSTSSAVRSCIAQVAKLLSTTHNISIKCLQNITFRCINYWCRPAFNFCRCHMSHGCSWEVFNFRFLFNHSRFLLVFCGCILLPPFIHLRSFIKFQKFIFTKCILIFPRK